jgi:hypothetical protein
VTTRFAANEPAGRTITSVRGQQYDSARGRPRVYTGAIGSAARDAVHATADGQAGGRITSPTCCEETEIRGAFRSLR